MRARNPHPLPPPIVSCAFLPCHPRGHASLGQFNSLPQLLKGSDQYTIARSESTIDHAPTANGCPRAYLYFASQANKATQNWPTPIHSSPHKKLCLVSPSREPGIQIGSWRTVNLDCRIARALLFYSSAFVWNLLLVCLAALVETPCVRLICLPLHEWTSCIFSKIAQYLVSSHCLNSTPTRSLHHLASMRTIQPHWKNHLVHCFRHRWMTVVAGWVKLARTTIPALRYAPKQAAFPCNIVDAQQYRDLPAVESGFRLAQPVVSSVAVLLVDAADQFYSYAAPALNLWAITLHI